MSLGSIPKVSPQKVSLHTASETAAPKVGPRGAFGMAAGLFAALVIAGTVLLWAHYGTTVFFETIRAGFAACFG
jgi:hypothetical protein